MTALVGVASDYGNLALSWTPENKLDQKFKFINRTVLIVMLAIGITLSAIDVPEEERRARPVISERIAQFIIEKEKVKIKKEAPKPEARQDIKKKLKEKPKPKKPVTKKQKQARNVAEKSGMLALKEELSGLMDTSEVSSMLAKNLSRPPSVSPGAATFDREQLFASAENDSGGISSDQYVSEISSTQLSDYQIAKVKQTLGSSTGSGKGAARKENSRTREDIAIVFDQNKSALYSSYKRARRKNPGLKGKIVLEITIAPNGKVTKVKIISSELNDAKLEKRIVARIKTFDFGEKKVKTMTVTYPIEFLPS